MWCRNCGQDVPGVPSFEEGEYSCDHCGEPLVPIWPESATAPQSASVSKEDAAKAGTASTASTAAQRPPIYDGWEIDEQLRHVRRVLCPAPPRGNSTALRPSRSFASMRATACRAGTWNESGGHPARPSGLPRARPGQPHAGLGGLDDLVAGHCGFRLRPGLDGLVDEHRESGSLGRRRADHPGRADRPDPGAGPAIGPHLARQPPGRRQAGNGRRATPRPEDGHHAAGHHARSFQRSSMPIGPAARERRSCWAI